jgi:hypothetical protein
MGFVCLVKSDLEQLKPSMQLCSRSSCTGKTIKGEIFV